MGWVDTVKSQGWSCMRQRDHSCHTNYTGKYRRGHTLCITPCGGPAGAAAGAGGTVFLCSGRVAACWGVSTKQAAAAWGGGAAYNVSATIACDGFLSVILVVNGFLSMRPRGHIHKGGDRILWWW